MKKLPIDFSIERYGLHVRLVDESDSEFILRLRLNEKHSRYINKTDANWDEQRKWILSYKEREREGLEYYFIFSLSSISLGVYRLYNINREEKSFTCGSWVFSADAPPGAGILGCIIGREIAYEDLELERCFTDVKKDNISSMRFQQSFNPIKLKEEDGSIYFEHIKLNFYRVKPNYIKVCTTLLRKNSNG